jgi:hypothetical protein
VGRGGRHRCRWVGDGAGDGLGGYVDRSCSDECSRVGLEQRVAGSLYVDNGQRHVDAWRRQFSCHASCLRVEHAERCQFTRVGDSAGDACGSDLDDRRRFGIGGRRKRRRDSCAGDVGRSSWHLHTRASHFAGKSCVLYVDCAFGCGRSGWRYRLCESFYLNMDGSCRGGATRPAGDSRCRLVADASSYEHGRGGQHGRDASVRDMGGCVGDCHAGFDFGHASGC